MIGSPGNFMSCITQVLGPPVVREDGLVLDQGLPRPIPPTWGPLAPNAAPDARYPAPIGESKILVSTSIHDIAQDSVDWASFVSYPQVEESRLMTPSRVYVLRKPPGWDARRYGLETWDASEADNAQKRAEVLEHNWRLIHSTVDTKMMKEEFNRLGVSHETHKIVSERETRLQATRYGVEFHIEARDEPSI